MQLWYSECRASPLLLTETTRGATWDEIPQAQHWRRKESTRERETERMRKEMREREGESERWEVRGPLSKDSAPLSFSWHRENIMQRLAPIESAWFIAQFETAKLLNCIRSAKIHSRTTEEIWKIKCHLGTVENFYLCARAPRNMLHSVMIDDGSALHLTYLVMSCRPRACLLFQNGRKT